MGSLDRSFRSRTHVAATAVALVVVLVAAVLSTAMAGTASADDGFTVQHAFTNVPDGSNPMGGVAQASNGRLYGTTYSGGCYDPGSIFSTAADGTDYKVLHSFAWTVATPPCGEGGYGWGDGTLPNTAPVDGGDGWLYGTTLGSFFAGTNNGTLYRIRPDGSGYQVLYYFAPGQDQLGTPNGQLVLAADGMLYGTATDGGPSNCGGVYRLNTPFSDPLPDQVVQNVVFFCPPGAVNPPKGARGGLIQTGGGQFYGVSTEGGAFGYGNGGQGNGTVFTMTVDRSGVGTVTTLHSFSNGEGANPDWQLVEGLDGDLYGTSPFEVGGAFRITPGGDFTHFGLSWANQPQGPLVQMPDGTFLGTSWGGGAFNSGTVFAMDSCGQFNFLHYMGSTSDDAADSNGNITLVGDTLWGTTEEGGSGQNGTLWSLPVAEGEVDTVQVASSQDPVPAGEPVTLTASVSKADGSQPSGSVTFFDGTTAIGSAPISSGQASLPPSSLSTGDHTITATYCGVTSPSLSQTVSPAGTSTAVASSLNPSMSGQSVTFTATVSSGAAGTPTGTVTFTDGATTLGTNALSGNTASLATSGLSIAGHTITATYNGDGSFTSSSGAVVQVVTAVVPVPSIMKVKPRAARVGARVSIRGTHLLGTTGVSVNGVACTRFVVMSDGRMRFWVPVGATSGKVTVTTPGGVAVSKRSLTIH
jgi:uncharacterized repeat protein (TIGR03803 family)